MAQLSGDEQKADGYHIGSITVTVNKRKDILEMRADDSASLRQFKSDFTIDQLKQCGFPQLLTLDQCVKVLISAMSNGRIQYRRQRPQMIDIEGPLVSDTQPLSEEHDVLTDDYIDGSSMILLVTQLVGPIEMVYQLRLEEIAVNPNNRLFAMMQQMKTEISQLKLVNETQSEALDAMQKDSHSMQQKIRSLEESIDEKKSDLEIAVWASATHIKKQGTDRTLAFWKWDCVIIEPPNGLFVISECKTAIKILKKGIYHIHGVGSSNGDKFHEYDFRQLCLLINDKPIYCSIANAAKAGQWNVWATPASMHFSTVHRCKANDVLDVAHSENRIRDDAACSRLIIHRLSS